jgi:hypothetical protein
MKVKIVVAALVAVLSSTELAHAQTYVYGAGADLMTGVQGGQRAAFGGMGRSGTALRVGADAYVDEFPKSILGISVLIGIEPKGAAGFDVRYMHKASSRLLVGVGGVGYVLPGSMFGGTAELSYRLPVATGAVTVGPQVNVFLQGSQLPEDTVLWQALARVGYRFDL